MELLTIDSLLAFVALSALEIILGIDNVIYIAILCGRLPKEQQQYARNVGLWLAMAIRIGLLFCISWLASLTTPLFSLSLAGKSWDPSTRDLVLGAGGLVLMAKAVLEMHHQVEPPSAAVGLTKKKALLSMILVQICLMDIIFSIDSVLTAIGMAQQLFVMVAAIIVAVLVMMVFAGAVSRIIDRHPTLKTLALSFLVLIGAGLVLESIHVHVPKGAIYFAMGFSLAVELVNIKMRGKTPYHPS
ncbi:MAG: TerC family protein [Phycisphaerales bacterium]|nr:TerC family protein [Phycisphaerales bacterium]